MRFGSVCSGIEAASVAWGPIGWKPAWFAEIEPFPCAVLAHHYPEVENLGDMTALPARLAVGEIEAPDVLCGGTPCQAFSVAGLRQSLDDARGNLTLIFCEIANEIDRVRSSRGEQPAVIFWENVPGVLSTKDNAFGCFLAGLAGEDDPLQPPGGKWTNAGYVLGPERAVAWRVTDAQYFGVAQRRRRVFVVASAREGFDPAAVLFEFDGVRRDSAPSREAGEGTSTGTGSGAAFGGGRTSGSLDDAACLVAKGQKCDFEVETFVTAQCTTGDVTHPLKAECFDALAFSCKDHGGDAGPLSPTLRSMGHDGSHANAGGQVAVMAEYYTHDYCHDRIYSTEGISPALNCSQFHQVRTAMQVRRLTPRECERLQGFPDDYTMIPWRKKPASECPDGPRYKALGNSWAVPNVRWIGRRIWDELYFPRHGCNE